MKKIVIGVLVLLLMETLYAGDTDEVDEIQVKKIKKKKHKKHKKIKQGLSATVELSSAYDSNVFITPKNAYVDYSTSTYEANGLVIPKKSAGMFSDYMLDLDYIKKYNKKLYFLGNYHTTGSYYYDTALHNANWYKQKLSAGAFYKIKNTNKRHYSVKINIYAGSDFNTYFDRDNGENKLTVSVIDISNRNRNTSSGLQGVLSLENRKWLNETSFNYEVLDFEKPNDWSELDHTYYLLKHTVAYAFTPINRIEFGLQYSVRDFLYRGSYAFTTKPVFRSTTTDPNANRVYTYYDTFIKQNFALSPQLKSSLKYAYTKRIDAYAGYNDSQRNKITTNFYYKMSKKHKFVAKLLYAYTSFPIAVAFDREPTDLSLVKGSKFYKNTLVDLKYIYKQNRKRAYTAYVRYRDYGSSDDRYVYDKLSAGVKVRYKF